MRKARLLNLVAVAVFAAGCGSSQASSTVGGSDSEAIQSAQLQEAGVLTIRDFAFRPSEVVAPDDKLVIKNLDFIPHGLQGSGGSFETDLIQPGEKIEITLPRERPIEFSSVVSPHLTGRIIAD